MYVIAKNGNSAYRVDKAAAVKIEDETSSFRELHPEIPGNLYIIRLYYDPENINIHADLAAYDDYETAWNLQIHDCQMCKKIQQRMPVHKATYHFYPFGFCQGNP